MGISIHMATLIPAILIYGIYFFFKNRLFDWRITIPLYAFFAFVFNPASIGVIAEYAQYISLGNKFQLYIDNADYWFGPDAAEAKYAQSAFALLASSLFHISFIYLGHRALKINPNEAINYLYNSVVFGLIFLRIVFLFEILIRFATPLVMLYFIPMGYILYTNKIRNKFGIKTISLNKLIFSAGLFFILFYHLLFWGRFIFLNPEAQFYWNVNLW